MGLKLNPWIQRAPEKLPPIDWPAIIAKADLRRLIEADLGSPDRCGRWVCPFHEGGRSPNLAIVGKGRRWKCWSGRCGLSGDAIDWLVSREGLTRVQAAKRLDPSLVTAEDLDRKPKSVTVTEFKAPPAPEPEPEPGVKTSDDVRSFPEPARAWQDPEWQSVVNAVVMAAELCLWSPEGRPALDWLRGRGLADETIRSHRLGFNPRPYRTDPVARLAGDDGPRGIYVARGVVLPWLAPWPPRDLSHEDPPDRWCGANVRCLADPVDAPLPRRRDGTKPAKTLCLRGSSRGYLYPMPEPWPGLKHRPALIVEGEIDALLADQHLGDQLPVFSVGGASTRSLAREARSVLARCPLWLVATDHDSAGVEAALHWRRLNPRKARRVLLPRGKDFAEFVAEGGDARAWLEEIKRKPL